jgi:hypothetical protein
MLLEERAPKGQEIIEIDEDSSGDDGVFSGSVCGEDIVCGQIRSMVDSVRLRNEDGRIG